ncbi:hypothetical protein GQR36_10410 [Enterococcus termitis]
MGRRSSNVTQKSLYKKWWFWIIAVLIIGVFGNFASSDEDNADTKKSDDQKTEVSTKTTETKKKIKQI